MSLKLLVLGSLCRPGPPAARIVARTTGRREWVGPVDIFVTGMLVFLSYEGFELIANASPQVTNPARALPIAFFGSVLVRDAAVCADRGRDAGSPVLRRHSPASSTTRSPQWPRRSWGGSGFWIHGGRRHGGGLFVRDQCRYLRLIEAGGDARRGRAAHLERAGTVFGGHHGAGMLFLMALGVIAATTTRTCTRCPRYRAPGS